ncbi:hypothetical protein BRADI_5g12198v3 [Brachypodium distachyon]|uniref:Uncharacterized protein n=1 Tax=Brachypodium distachyon TaxID=15368 RepID=A0A2K2CGR9_BRADI|nr:hypothetical protein BRADI_5g12198v3 [Brachypodium distachyon]
MGTRGKERRRFCLPEAAFPVRDVGGMRSRGAGANTIPWRLHVEMDLLVLYGQFGDRRDSIAMKHIGLLMMHGQLGEGRQGFP